MFWEKRWLISHQTHRSYIASGLRVGLVKYQNQASVVLMFGCASPSDPVSDPVCCSLQSWCLPNRHSPKHRLKPPHLLPEGSTLRRGRQWPGLGLLGAPQVHTGISFWLNSAENILDFRVSASQPWPLLAVSYVPSDPVGDAWLGGGKGQSGWDPKTRGLRFVPESESQKQSLYVKFPAHVFQGKHFWKLTINRNTYFWVLMMAWKQAFILEKAVSKVDPQWLQGDLCFIWLLLGGYNHGFLLEPYLPHFSLYLYLLFSKMSFSFPHVSMPVPSLQSLMGRVSNGRSGEAGDKMKLL